MIETTVNKSKGDKLSSASLYDYLTSFGLKVLLIANELTPISDELHFHILIDAAIEEVPQVLIAENWIFRDVRDLSRAVSYFTKHGRYKVYNGFVVPKVKRIDESELLAHIIEGKTYKELLQLHGLAVMKYAYYIKLMKEEPKKFEGG